MKPEQYTLLAYVVAAALMWGYAVRLWVGLKKSK